MAELDTDEVSSPCVGICKVNASSLCIGCHRTLEEIARYRQASADERRVINQNAARRKSSE